MRNSPGVARSPRRIRRGLSGVTVLLILVLGVGVYLAFRHVQPLLAGSGCDARTTGQGVVSLDTGQAAIAATIAGVANHKALPARAVTVAYAAALQESKLTNLGFGDRDSVGVFQQRPSEGWGPRQLLIDPVYATTKFFDALVKVPGYRKLPVYMAAQAVQHSADGYAYDQYAPVAAGMATAFTGHNPHSVWCWYGQAIGPKPSQQAIGLELAKTFGPLPVRTASDPRMMVRARDTRSSWAVAAWLVSHAQQYDIDMVWYAGYRWTAASGSAGWTRDRSPVPPGELELS
ncbi:MAG: hypothetical protein ABSB01_04440 [Streptosporangiaceae bacterium]